MTTFNIPARKLKAACMIAAKNDLRLKLNSVCVQNGKLISTDGCRLLAISVPELNDLPQDASFLLPAEACQSVIKQLKASDLKQNINITISLGAECRMQIENRPDSVRIFRLIDEHYVDWRRVVRPLSLVLEQQKQTVQVGDSDPVAVNPRYLMDAQEVQAILMGVVKTDSRAAKLNAFAVNTGETYTNLHVLLPEALMVIMGMTRQMPDEAELQKLYGSLGL